jgi:hypothetical protein
MEGSLGAQIRTGVQAASLKIVEDTHSARARRGQPKLVDEQSQQPCGVDARQHTIASDSCCCTLGEGRSRPDFRTESPEEDEHAQADRNG